VNKCEPLVTGGGGGELVDVRYTPPMFVTAVEVHESFSTGAGASQMLLAVS